MLRKILLVLLLATVAAALAAVAPGRALGYGHADQPVAQVEISANCNNASVCPDLTGGGEGGFWIWAELDDLSGTGSYGTTDFTFAGCGHTVGGGGPGGAGAGGGPGEGTWQRYDSIFAAVSDLAGRGELDQFFPVAIVLDGGQIDPTVPYYVIDVPDPQGGPDTFFAVPAAYGHYDLSGIQLQVDPDTFQVVGVVSAPGLSFQTQVAP